MNANVIIKKPTCYCDLEDYNQELIVSNRRLKVGLIGLAALAVCSIGSCRKKSSALDHARQENADLQISVSDFQKDAANLSIENQALRHYANDAYDFVLSIQEPMPTEPDSITSLENKDEMIRVGSEAAKEDAKAKAEYDKACDVLGFNEKERQEQLIRLKRGWLEK